MATIPTAAPAPGPQASMSAIGRIWGTFFSPKATFEDICRSPSWIAPILLLTILSLCGTTIFSRRVGWEKLVLQQLEKSPRTAQMSPEQRQQTIAQQAKVAEVIGYVASGLFFIIATLLIGAIYMGAFNLLAGAGIRFPTALAIVSHSLLPLGVGSLMGIAVLLLKDPETIDLEHLVSSNVGAFLSADSPKWLSALGSSLDIFSIWALILMGVGFSVANPKKISFGKGLGIVLSVWAIYVLAKTGIKAVLS
jgi:hypothetical protein